MNSVKSFLSNFWVPVLLVFLPSFVLGVVVQMHYERRSRQLVQRVVDISAKCEFALQESTNELVMRRKEVEALMDDLSECSTQLEQARGIVLECPPTVTKERRRRE